MNIFNGHNGAQGIPLPENNPFDAFTYGLSEASFEKLARAKDACDLLQQLFAQHPQNDGLPFGSNVPGVAALMDYLYSDLADVTDQCGPLTEARK
ncbi:hypothetical protein [Pantoea cypripedii]|uniref:Uncharacterized protein n=1 Tax=Pantoea cypripedii TaxID=55209 RepID=A0A1X1EP98_PANCY|nr:hypothetical protein [Pantoea cypripedii]MBP2195850.1 hypothetical protein [Pantoea cypripedii]ORM91828.1 hypothetical protein HA50_00050 [Pantoea cypripedii]